MFVFVFPSEGKVVVPPVVPFPGSTTTATVVVLVVVVVVVVDGLLDPTAVEALDDAPAALFTIFLKERMNEAKASAYVVWLNIQKIIKESTGARRKK